MSRAAAVRPRVAGVATALAATALAGCTVTQDAFQVGQREFQYATAADVEQSGESFRFQGFLPDDATDVRLVAQLDGHAAVMRWTSPTAFTSPHCTDAPVTSEPELTPEWLPDPLPTDGVVCRSWSVVRSQGTQVAWTNSREE